MLPGGRLVYGGAIWSSPPHPAAPAPVAGRDDEFLSRVDLREQILAVGFEVVDDDHPSAEQVRRRYEEQRAAYEVGVPGRTRVAYFCLRG